MSIVLLIDGYNLIAPVAAPGRGGTDRWLEEERRRLIHRLTTHLPPHVLCRTCLIFDAKNAPKGQPSTFNQNGMTIRFAVDYDEADDLLEELIRSHDTPKQLSVVSSDHRVQTAARRRRAGFFDADVWLDDLLDGHLRLIKHPKLPSDSNSTDSQQTSQSEVSIPTPAESAASKVETVEPDDELQKFIDDEDLQNWMQRYQ